MPDDSFKEFVIDQLSDVSDVRARAMFGAHGLYSGEHFFGIIDQGRLFFKTDAKSEADYMSRGMEPFKYESRGKVIALAFHEVPPDVLEQPLELATWARKAVQVAAAKRTKAAKVKTKTIPRRKK